MCLYPKLIRNRKYMPNRKNGGNVPTIPDMRLQYVTAACGRCYECRKQKARSWQIRLSEELRSGEKAYFVTLTLTNGQYEKLSKESGSISENDVATLACRRFLERCRKANGKSLRHWFVTELGHENTKRLHLHGIVFGKNADVYTKEHWEKFGYGIAFIGKYCTERSINYCTKYMLKDDLENKDFRGKILCSAGLGKKYIERPDARNNVYKENGETKETYRFRNGSKANLPIYYRNKIYTEVEREKLFIEKIEKGIKWVCGEMVNIRDENAYINLLLWHRERCKKIHFDNEENWERQKYINRLQAQKRYDYKSNITLSKIKRGELVPCLDGKLRSSKHVKPHQVGIPTTGQVGGLEWNTIAKQMTDNTFCPF